MKNKNLLIIIITSVFVLSATSFLHKLFSNKDKQAQSSKVALHTLEEKDSKLTPTAVLNKTDNPIPKSNRTVIQDKKYNEPKETKWPFVIRVPEDFLTYIVITKSKKLIVIKGNKQVTLSKRSNKLITIKLIKTGLRNSVCYRKGRFLYACYSGSNKKLREVYIKLMADLIIIANQEEKTLDQENLFDFMLLWRQSWERIKEHPKEYIKLYSPEFKSIYGNKEKWLSIRTRNLDKVKYIDITIKDPVIVKIPSTNNYLIIFHQIYRSNLKRVEGVKALVVRYEENKIRIIREMS